MSARYLRDLKINRSEKSSECFHARALLLWTAVWRFHKKDSIVGVFLKRFAHLRRKVHFSKEGILQRNCENRFWLERLWKGCFWTYQTQHLAQENLHSIVNYLGLNFHKRNSANGSLAGFHLKLQFNFIYNVCVSGVTLG